MRYSLPRSFLVSFEHRAPFVTLRVSPPSRREAIIQKSREKSRLFVQSINASHELFKFSERGSVRLLFLLFFPGGTAGFSAAKMRIFHYSLPVFLYTPHGVELIRGTATCPATRLSYGGLPRYRNYSLYAFITPWGCLQS